MEEKNAEGKGRGNVHTGLCSVGNILRHMGISVSDQDLIREYRLKDKELQWKSLSDVAQKYKLKAEVLKPTADELREIPVPALVRFKGGSYAVIGVNNDEAVFLLDPNQEKPVAMPRATFIKVWSGEVMTFMPRLTWQLVRKRFNLDWFYSVILHYKRPFIEVAIASLFLQSMGIALPLFTQVVVDKVIANSGMSTLTVLGIAMAVFCVFQGLMGGLRTYLLSHTTNKLDAILGTRLFRHLIALPLPYYEHRRVGDTLMRVGALNSVREFLTGTTLTTILDLVFSVVFILFMLYYSVPLTLIALIVIPLYIVQNVWAMPIVRRKIEEVWRTGAARQSFLIETVTGMQTVKSMAVEPQFAKKWEHLLSRYVQATFNSAAFNIVIGTGSQMIQRISTLAILWYGGHMVMDGKFTLGQLIAFQMIASQALTPLTKILSMWPNVQQMLLSLERLGDILHTRMEPIFRSPAKALPAVQGKIVMKDVSFRYRLDTPLALNKVSLTVEAGQKIGIVGRSGSGKSTLTSIVQRLYIPESGQVLIDDVDLAQADYNWIRGHIGVVMQDNYLFNGSVRDNIALAKPTAGMDEVIQAAKMAGAHEFILELEEGYDTKVGERGAGLSGGQRQRIAIARALLTNPPVLIFDEATSALDYESERIIMGNLENIAAQRTMLIIAHRLSTVEKCDKIIVVDRGSIAEAGTHDELIAYNGIYKNLYEQQEVG